jgi:hypothetical protein
MEALEGKKMFTAQLKLSENRGKLEGIPQWLGGEDDSRQG